MCDIFMVILEVSGGSRGSRNAPPLSQFFKIFMQFRQKISVADPGFSPGGGAPTPKSAIIFQFFAENCMKMKEFGPPGGGGGGRVPGAPPPLDPPMDMPNKKAFPVGCVP